eukprot:gb/GFBE01070681.1/.p1 GENE.gb/GFBE01070681.1/~~gb/GFBE01070681.1/.p1  ORF type:complete len:244 (+),score=29.75 gb/GFBE01070681.1/:1-732(+)
MRRAMERRQSLQTNYANHRRGSFCLRASLVVAAVAGFSMLPGRLDATFLAQRPAQAEASRRTLAASVLGMLLTPTPAHAGLDVAAFSSGGLVPYTVGGVFTVSMPDNYKVLKETPEKMTFQGDRAGDLNTMAASARVTTASTLEAALNMTGQSLEYIGEELSNKRPFGGSDFYGVKKIDNADAYRFEFINDRLHEYVLHALVKKGSTNYLCTVLLRAPGLLWTDGDRYLKFAKILETFEPVSA